MASLSVRKIDDEVYEQLRLCAAKHGVSMEEEARRIIRRSVMAPENLGHLARQCFGADYGVDLELQSHSPHEPVRFEP